MPSFQFTDYEHSNSTIARRSATYLLYPDVISTPTLRALGYREDRLLPFPGLKEAISFAGVDIGAAQTYVLPQPGIEDRRTILFRPPSERAHYFVRESLSLALDLLEQLADRDDVVVIFAPRYPSQIEHVERLSWKIQPVILDEGIPFVSLLKALDGVISSGGTMLREAAFLGIPAFSILQSEIGQVDRYLESIGRLTVLSSADDFKHVSFVRATLDPLPSRAADIVGTVVEMILTRAAAGRR